MKDIISRLHKGLGVRRPDLHAFLGPALCAGWGINDRDQIHLVREKVTDRISGAMHGHVERDHQEVVLGWYNAGDNRLWPLRLEERLVTLALWRGVGNSPSSLRRIVTAVLPAVEQSLIPGPTRPPGHANQADLRRRLRGTLHAMHRPEVMVRESVQLLRRCAWHVPGESLDRLRVVRLGRDDMWLCAFSSLERYYQYRTATGAPWPAVPPPITGDDLIRDLHHRWPGTGLLCDPPPRVGGDVTETLCLPASLVADLVVRPPHHQSTPTRSGPWPI